MYSIEWSRIFSRKRHKRGAAPESSGAPSDPVAPAKSWRQMVSPTVWGLGITSLFTDISSEMVASILPLYLVLHLGISPLAFGVVDGIYQGAAALVRIVGGVLADRWRRHKEIAAFGYGLSALCRLLLLVVGGVWGWIAAVISLDRIGKGIRTAPRDALIAQRSPSHGLATAFGVHRAMDAVGAMLGPVVAFALLALIPGGFDVLFITSFGVAVIGVGAILLFVPASAPEQEEGKEEPQPAPSAVKLLNHVKCPSCRSTSAHCPKSISVKSILQLLAERRFRGLLIAGMVLGLVTISDSFIYLILQKRLSVGMTAFPLFYVGTSLVTSMFAIPCGRIADRLGRAPMLLAGYATLALVYVVILQSYVSIIPTIVLTLLLLGMFYAATDGVLAAMAAAILPLNHAGSGLAILATATNLTRFVASVSFGFFWSRAGVGPATFGYLIALTVGLLCAALLLNRNLRTAT